MNTGKATAQAPGFPANTREEWEKCATESLKGRPLSSLRFVNEDELELEPLYWPRALDDKPTPNPSEAPTRDRAGSWEIRQATEARNALELRAELAELLARGQQHLPLELEAGLGRDWSPAELREALSQLPWGHAGLDLLVGPRIDEGLRLLQGLPAGQHRLICDWIDSSLREGRRAVGAAGRLATLWRSEAAPAAWLRVGGYGFHAAGASGAQELALWLASWTASVRELEEAGCPLEAGLTRTEHELSCGRDLFESLARLRAARLLAARWLEAAGVPVESRRIVLGARGSLRSQTRRDPWTNLLRTSLAGFAAAVGGADFLHLPTWLEGLGKTDAHARRLASNLQVILQDEAHLAQVADPARGSWYLEQLSGQLAEKAWGLFQQLEAAGGLWSALAAGLPQGWIRATRESRAERLARRGEILVGTNHYARLEESLPAGLAHCDPPATPPREPEFEPLSACRLAGVLETLRERGERQAGAWRSPVWLSTFGPLKQHKARAEFSRAFLACGGLPCAQGEGHADPLQAAHEAQCSGAPVVVLCSSDESYPDLVPSFVRTLRALEAAQGRNPALLLLAGHPAEQLESLRAAGIQDFIHLKASLPRILLLILNRLEESA